MASTALRNILFTSGSAVLDPRSEAQIKELAAMMREHPEMSLVIKGHTDDRPAKGVIEVRAGVQCRNNQCLSLERARSVCLALTDLGIPSQRMTNEGYGDSRPVDVMDRSRNRRMQLRIGK